MLQEIECVLDNVRDLPRDTSLRLQVRDMPWVPLKCAHIDLLFVGMRIEVDDGPFRLRFNVYRLQNSFCMHTSFNCINSYLCRPLWVMCLLILVMSS